MSRRSIYRTSRTNNAAYGPKTDSNVQHWEYDFIELATTREEESETPQKGNAFRVKTWIKIEDSQYKPLDIGVEDDTLELVNRIQAAADEIANKEGELGVSETPEVVTSTSVLPEPEEPKAAPPKIEETASEPPASESAQTSISQSGSFEQSRPSQLITNEPEVQRITEVQNIKADELQQNSELQPETKKIDEHAMEVDTELESSQQPPQSL